MNVLNIQIGYQQLLETVKQLPENQIAQLVIDLQNIAAKTQPRQQVSDFQQFLLAAPTMPQEQYDSFIENRKKFNQWRTK